MEINIPICSFCLKRPCEKDYTKSSALWRKKCDKCRRPNRKMKGSAEQRRWKKIREKFDLSICKICGFIPKSKVQMDIHHLDNNHQNNNLNNLQSVCANCHRLIHLNK